MTKIPQCCVGWYMSLVIRKQFSCQSPEGVGASKKGRVPVFTHRSGVYKGKQSIISVQMPIHPLQFHLQKRKLGHLHNAGEIG